MSRLSVPCPGPVVSPQEERPSGRHQDAQQVHQVWSQVSLRLLHAHQDRQQTPGGDRGRVSSRLAAAVCVTGVTLGFHWLQAAEFFPATGLQLTVIFMID